MVLSCSSHTSAFNNIITIIIIIIIIITIYSCSAGIIVTNTVQYYNLHVNFYIAAVLYFIVGKNATCSHEYTCIFMYIHGDIIKIAELVSSSFLNQATASLGGYFFNFFSLLSFTSSLRSVHEKGKFLKCCKHACVDYLEILYLLFDSDQSHTLVYYCLLTII